MTLDGDDERGTDRSAREANGDGATAREQALEKREALVEALLSQAVERDRLAELRDRRAEQRDRAAERRTGCPEELARAAAADRAQAAVDRYNAGVDRDHSATDRADLIH